jgi:hypothetical protein
MEYDKLPDLKMTAIAVLFQMHWTSKKTGKAGDFIVKEALTNFTSFLEDDDIGYFYDPASPKHLCIHPGELCGKIGNSSLPYSFNFLDGLKHLSYFLNALDDYDYNKVCVIVTDCFDPIHESFMLNFLNELDSKVYVYEIGKDLLSKVCKSVGANYELLSDAIHLEDKLAFIRESLSNTTRKWN